MWLQAVLNLQGPVEHSKEVSDCKNLIKTLVMGNFLSSVPSPFQNYLLSLIVTNWKL